MQTIDQRIQELEATLSAFGSALQNTLLVVVSALNKQPGFDREAMSRELEELKTVQVQGGQQRLYEEAITMIQNRLS